MTTPAILFCLLVGALYGCVYHLIHGGNFFSLLVYIVVAIAGFFLGHYLGTLTGVEFIHVGMINFGNASIISIICLVISGLISRPLL